MKKIVLGIVCLLAGALLASGQDMTGILNAIEQNNTTLAALREQVESDKLSNRTGISLADPEVEFNYLWGSPGAIGKRNDFSVSQSFDVASLTGVRRRVANGQNMLVDLQYKADRMDILLEAKRLLIELVYCNALRQELKVRLVHAHAIAEATQRRLDAGDTHVLEYNKARLNLSTVEGEFSRIEVERAACLEELKRLNGGSALSFDATRYPEIYPAADFEQWFAEAEQRNPILEYVRREVEVNRHQVSLARAEGFPELSAGYMREKTLGESYQGVSVGVSIPLWQNRNRVKQARAAVRATEARQEDSRQQFYARLCTLYNRAEGLRRTADAYRRSLSEANSTALLQKALDAGEISLLEYLVEMGIYYEIVTDTLDAERDYQLALAELSAVEL